MLTSGEGQFDFGRGPHTKPAWCVAAHLAYIVALRTTQSMSLELPRIPRLKTLDQIFSALGRKSAVPQEQATSTRPRKGNLPRDGRLKAPSAKPPTMPKKMPARVLKDEASQM